MLYVVPVLRGLNGVLQKVLNGAVVWEVANSGFSSSAWTGNRSLARGMYLAWRQPQWQ